MMAPSFVDINMIFDLFSSSCYECNLILLFCIKFILNLKGWWLVFASPPTQVNVRVEVYDLRHSNCVDL